MPSWPLRRPALVGSLLALPPLACATQPGPMPLCVAETVASDTMEVQERQLEPVAWFNVLLHQWDRETGRVEQPARDCLRREVKWALPEACPVEPVAEPLPERPLIAEDIVISNVDDRHDLVWIITRRHVDGTGTGPVALVEWIERGVAVRAMGPLHAPIEAARMRLEPLGTGDDGDELLVVESELCAPPPPDPYDLLHPAEGAGQGSTEAPPKPRCQPVTTLVPILDGQVIPTALEDEGGGCLAAASFFNLDAVEVDLAEGWARRFDLATELRFEGGEIIVREQVRVTDRDPLTPASPPRPFRTVDDERSIALVGRRLVTSRVGLLERVLARDARIDGTEVPVGERRKVALPEPAAPATPPDASSDGDDGPSAPETPSAPEAASPGG